MAETADKEVDVLVIGSGAGALLAANVVKKAGGDVLVIEKADQFGGASAASGGAIWVPASSLARADGHQDSEDEAFQYLRELSADNVPDSMIRTYVREAKNMLDWVQENTEVSFTSSPYPDFHVEVPGGKPGYRTHIVNKYDGRRLGDDLKKMRPLAMSAMLFRHINLGFESVDALLFRTKGWQLVLAKLLWHYASDLPFRLTSLRDRNLDSGNALVGRLYFTMRQLGIPLLLETELVEYTHSNGEVTGVIAKQKDKEIRIRARKGVITGTGGFERSRELRSQYLPGSADPTVSASQINNTGDAHHAAKGLDVQMRNLQSTWSAPVFRVPGEPRSRLITIERSLPGCITVNADAQRFLNESASYHVVGKKMIEIAGSEAASKPFWLIFDAPFHAKYPMGPFLPGVPLWLHPPQIQKMVYKANSLEELAAKVGLSGEALRETVEFFNSEAEAGKDTLFQRGDLKYDRLFGDYRITPNPNLAPITKAPFYAVPCYAGDIGTNGGFATDDNAQALNNNGEVIKGLYVIGNAAASVMGESYPGAGVTLGPAMTFGYLAARHVMGIKSDAPAMDEVSENKSAE